MESNRADARYCWGNPQMKPLINPMTGVGVAPKVDSTKGKGPAVTPTLNPMVNLEPRRDARDAYPRIVSKKP